MKMTCKYIVLLSILTNILLVSCYEDKGNYSYSEVEKIEIALPDNILAMAHAEYVSFSPKVVSSMHGEIAENDPDYEYNCKINYIHTDASGKDVQWLDINPEKTKDIHFFADVPANTYTIWYSITNKETGVTTNAKGNVKILSSTYEGWMVLSNVGADNTVRMDMISKNSQGITVVATDILGDNAPVIKDATSLIMNPSKFYMAETVFLMSHTGAYRLNVDNLQTTEGDNIKMSDFILPTTPGIPLSMLIINSGGSSGPISRVCVTDIGDVYAITSGNSGASFEYLMNTNKVGADATFKVSPMTGTSMARPGNSSCALLYDVTNKRFVGWNYNAEQKKLVMELNDPGEGQKFSYRTGMTLIDMESTRYSDGLVYSVLQDDRNQRHVYGINLSGSKFTQESVYQNILMEHFNDATDYAFHSQYPFMFYSYGNKIYSYNLGTGAMNEILTLAADETITKLKFNLYMNMDLSDLNDQSDEFLNKQYNLIVASTTNEENGGIIRFYGIDTTGKMKQMEEYKGFGKVVDITYRERRAN